MKNRIIFDTLPVWLLATYTMMALAIIATTVVLTALTGHLQLILPLFGLCLFIGLPLGHDCLRLLWTLVQLHRLKGRVFLVEDHRPGAKRIVLPFDDDRSRIPVIPVLVVKVGWSDNLVRLWYSDKPDPVWLPLDLFLRQITGEVCVRPHLNQTTRLSEIVRPLSLNPTFNIL